MRASGAQLATLGRAGCRGAAPPQKVLRSVMEVGQALGCAPGQACDGREAHHPTDAEPLADARQHRSGRALARHLLDRGGDDLNAGGAEPREVAKPQDEVPSSRVTAEVDAAQVEAAAKCIGQSSESVQRCKRIKTRVWPAAVRRRGRRLRLVDPCVLDIPRRDVRSEGTEQDLGVDVVHAPLRLPKPTVIVDDDRKRTAIVCLGKGEGGSVHTRNDATESGVLMHGGAHDCH